MSEDRARAEILARVRHASVGQSAKDIAQELATLDTGPPPVPKTSDLCCAFFAQVLRNGGTLDMAADRSTAVKAVANYLLANFRSSKIVASGDPRLAAFPWREAGVLPRFGTARSGDAAALSFARLAVAETGAIVTYTGRNNAAGHNLLAESHIVLLDLGDLYPTLEDAWAQIHHDLHHQGRPRGINFIAGPSSTADVEAQLVLGAHGPRRWHIIALGDVPESTLNTARRLAGQADQSAE